MVVFVLSSAGDQVPVYPLMEVVGNALNELPKHMGATVENVGVILGLTTMVWLASLVQPPEVGVKVYRVVCVLFIAGDQVPVMELLDTNGRGFNTSPEHIDATGSNSGETESITCT